MRAAARRAGRVALIVASFIFLGLVLVRQRHELLAFEWRVEPLRLMLSAVAFAAVLIASVAIWGRTLRRFDVRAPFPVLARIWFLSNLSRYIPGKIWQFVGVVELSRAAGLPALTTLTSVFLYMGFVLTAACFVGASLLPATGPLAHVLIGLRFALPLFLLVTHPRVINTMVRWTSRVTRRPLAAWTGNWSDGLSLLALCILEWLGLGSAFALFVGSITPVGIAAYPTLVAAFALSFVAGYIVLLPAGLGAKEGALAILLGTVAPLPVAAAIAVGARVWTVLAEVLPVCIFLRPWRRWADATRGVSEPQSLQD